MRLCFVVLALVTSPDVASTGITEPVRRGEAATFSHEDVRRGPSTAGAGACASCHSEIAREWASSSHHRSASSPSYVDAVTRDAPAFCRACHAPLGDPAFPTQGVAFETGIGCTTCHAREHGQPTKTCASCHEFSFPNQSALMQRTQQEHRASAFSETACSTCHMSRSGGHRDHRFEVTSMLQQALVADISRASATRVAFRLSPGRIGHLFPTGDLFRRLSVRVESSDGVARTEKHLARHFLDAGGKKIEQRDDRVGGPDVPSCFELEVRGSTSAELVASIALEHVDAPLPGDALVARRFPIVQKSLPSESYRPCP